MVRSATFGAQPDAAALLAQAEYETGLHDFGDGQFRGPLDALVRFLNPAVNPLVATLGCAGERSSVA